MIYVGIDDTDIEGSRGTNHLARALVATLSSEFRCVRIVRHQLLYDPRVPYTSKNGSASIALEPHGDVNLRRLAGQCRDFMLADFIEGSDPGLCVATSVPQEVTQYAMRCQAELITQAEAYELARRHEIYLEGLGGTNGGVIGALAAIGLAVTGNDGRVIQLAQWPDDMSGLQPVEQLQGRGVSVCSHCDGEKITDGLVDVGKKLRPNRRRGETVLFVETVNVDDGHPLKAVKLP